MKLIAISLITFALSFGEAYSQDNECDPTLAYSDLNNAAKNNVITSVKHNGKKLGPTRDQDSVGYCYAYASADVLEDWFKESGQIKGDENISAMGIALANTRENWIANSGPYKSLASSRNLLAKSFKDMDEEKRELEKKIVDLKKTDEDKKKSSSTSLEDAFADIEDLFASFIDPPKLDVSTKDNEKEIEDLKKKIGLIEENKKVQIGFLRMMEDNIDIKEGGNVAKTIMHAWNKLCFESEINSRDSGFHDLYKSSQDYFDNKHYGYAPEDLPSALKFISEEQYSNTTNSCVPLRYVNEMFPGSSFFNSDQLLSFLSKISDKDSVINELVKESCKRKTFNRPTLSSVSKDNGDSIDKILGVIDSAIDKGRLSAVSYKSEMFNTLEFEDSKSNHASVITGSMKICGVPYYRLRNSWGKEACNSRQSSFSVLATHDLRINELKLELAIATCLTEVEGAAFDKFGECEGDGKCLEAREKFVSENSLKCSEGYDEKKRDAVGNQYFCDTNGDFIIKRSYFKRGVYRADAINN